MHNGSTPIVLPVLTDLHFVFGSRRGLRSRAAAASGHGSESGATTSAGRDPPARQNKSARNFDTVLVDVILNNTAGLVHGHSILSVWCGMRPRSHHPPNNSIVVSTACNRLLILDQPNARGSEKLDEPIRSFFQKKKVGSSNI